MVKKINPETEKKGVSVVELATKVGVTSDRLLHQFVEAGITGIENEKDIVNEAQQQKLLRYLQQHHGAKQENGPEKIILRRAKTSEIKLGGSHGAGKTISVQVRKKRTYVKRSPSEDDGNTKLEVISAEAEGMVLEPVVEEATAAIDMPHEAQEAGAQPTAVIPAAEEAVPTSSAEGAPAEQALSAEEQKKKEEKAKAAVVPLKRKEKHREGEDVEETEAERVKKKRRSKDNGRNAGERNFEALLSRGADLSRVFKEEDDSEASLRRNRGGRAGGLHSKVRIQAFTKPTAPIIKTVEIPENIILGELAQKLSVKAAEIIKVMLKMGVIATINQPIDQDTAVLVVEELGHKAVSVSRDAIEHALNKQFDTQEGDALPRPPVITIMGHVDHGKTTLLDYIRRTKVAASEAGGITQHIGAYHVQTEKGTITFLDTPGHAAFTAMRARGAKLTDIVILVVAADDGVMPQTIEAIQHAKAAQVPIVVAVNKMDKQGIDADRVKNELVKHGLVPEEWGGDAMFVPISAKTGSGVDNLLDSVLVQAEVLELKAIVDCPARGVVIESRVDKGRGAVMSVLIQQGTLHKSDIILAGLEYGRIRALYDENSKTIESAGPSIPVEILGLSGIAQAGDDFFIVPDEKHAKEVTSFRQAKARESKLTRHSPKLEDLLQRIEDEKLATTTLNLVIKADVLGSVEALKQTLSELSFAEVKINILSSGIGGINESDVNLAIASNAIMIAFNVRANTEARKLIELNEVDIHYYNIIYDVINEVKKAISGALAPEIQEKTIGLAEVREVFRASKTGAVAGCMVIEGNIKRNFPARVLRDNVVVFEGVLESLRRFKDDVSEVRNGMECGISLKNYSDVKPGDQIEVFERIEVRRQI